IRRRCYNLILAESKFKNLVLDHQDKYMMKAQVHVSKSFAISDEQALPRRKHDCQIYQMINFTSGVKCQLQFMDVEIEQDDLNQKFLTSLAPEWLMHTIVWRNMSDLDTISLDDLYNHLKVYESKCRRNQSQTPRICGSQIKFEDINQIDEDDMEEMNIKWNMALLSMRADRPSPAIESTSDDAQNKNPSEASSSTISPKPFIKFVKANDSPTKSKTDKVETAKKPHVKYAEQYRKPTKKPNVRGNQRNWNNLKSHKL
nr:ribonuclease H-like domain-containing protein [Tanacetum cinerariifolium]